MLHSGDLNPHWFKYPTLPTHLTAACLTLGYFYACSNLELKSVNEIGSVVYPYYTHPNVVLPAKLLFALLSILSLTFVGLIGYRALGQRSLLFLVPLILSMSALYLQQSWAYLNVDIIGCFFVMCVMLLLFRDVDEKSVFRRCIALGVLCGLTISSKYSLFLVVLPCLLHLLLYDWKRWPTRCLIVIGAMIATFFLVVPVLGDYKAFLGGVGAEAYHYKQGHKGFDGNPGLAQLLYYLKAIIGDYGWASPWLATLGILYMFRMDWKKGSVLVIFPATYLLYMSTQRVHFVRNVVCLLPFFSLFLAAGLLGVYRMSRAGVARLDGRSKHRRLAMFAIIGAGILLLVLSPPWSRINKAYDSSPESRNVAEAWAKANIPEGSTLFIPVELGMNPRAFEETYKVVGFSLRTKTIAETQTQLENYKGAYIFLPTTKNGKWRSFSDSLQHLTEFGTRAVRADADEPVTLAARGKSHSGHRRPFHASSSYTKLSESLGFASVSLPRSDAKCRAAALEALSPRTVRGSSLLDCQALSGLRFELRFERGSWVRLASGLAACGLSAIAAPPSRSGR